MRRLALGFILLGALIPAVSLALGLGEIEVESALNQPLKARIQLLGADSAEIDSITARLASEEVFRRVGLDRPFYLNNLRFQPTVEAGRPVILITTEHNVREPFLNFLVEVSWPNGRLTREYTILLDPPLYMPEKAAAAAQPPAVPAAAPARATDVRPRPGPAVAAPSRPPGAAAAAAPEAAAMAPAAERGATEASGGAGGVRPETIEVARGDTLWAIAEARRPQGVSINQMMMALFRANPEAFGDNNINNLRRGYILRIPGREEIEALSQEEAARAVREQNALWREYRRRLADQAVPQMTAEAPEASEVSEAPEAEAAFSDEDAPGAPAGGRVELLGTASGVDGSTAAVSGAEGAEEELALLKQALEARRQENIDLRARVEELERLIEDKNRLLELKDQQLAELQARLGGPSAVESPDDSGPVVEPQEPAAGAESVPESLMTVESEPGGSEEAAVPETQPSASPAPAEPKAVEESEAAPPAQSAPRSFMGDLLSNPQRLMVVGFGGLLVLALVWLLVRRLIKRGRAEGEDEDDSAPALGAAADKEKETEAQATAATPAEEAEAPAAEHEPDSESKRESEAESADEGEAEAKDEGGEIESDDVTAEADVYLAYGLHQQAEDLLKGALADHPDKDVYRLKLLETYYATKDKAAFDALAGELHERLGGQGGVMWDRVVAMGKELSPDNPLFSGADAGGLSVADFAPRKPEGTDIELDLDEQQSSAPAELDIGLDQEEPAEEALDLDLDLDDTQVFQADEAGGDPTQEAAEVTSASSVDETAEIDLDLEAFDAGEAPTAVSQAPDASQETVDISLDQDEGGLDLDIESVDVEEAQLEASPVEETAEIDLDELGDLGGAFGGNEPTDLNEQLSSADLGAADEDVMISEGDEVDTKLDLAKAYIDMGDAEGARSTLEEVMAEGNEAQRREAQELMQQIA